MSRGWAGQAAATNQWDAGRVHDAALVPEAKGVAFAEHVGQVLRRLHVSLTASAVRWLGSWEFFSCVHFCDCAFNFYFFLAVLCLDPWVPAVCNFVVGSFSALLQQNTRLSWRVVGRKKNKAVLDFSGPNWKNSKGRNTVHHGYANIVCRWLQQRFVE